jgi:hypothetical protein
VSVLFEYWQQVAAAAPGKQLFTTQPAAGSDAQHNRRQQQALQHTRIHDTSSNTVQSNSVAPRSSARTTQHGLSSLSGFRPASLVLTLRRRCLAAPCFSCSAQCWWTFISCTVMVALFVDPFSLAFAQFPGLYPAGAPDTIFSVICTLLYACDVALNFFVAYYEDGVLVTDLHRIAGELLSTQG